MIVAGDARWPRWSRTCGVTRSITTVPAARSTLGVKSGSVVLTVADTGRGILEATARRSSSVYRVDKACTRAAGGSGLAWRFAKDRRERTAARSASRRSKTVAPRSVRLPCGVVAERSVLLLRIVVVGQDAGFDGGSHLLWAGVLRAIRRFQRHANGHQRPEQRHVPEDVADGDRLDVCRFSRADSYEARIRSCRREREIFFLKFVPDELVHSNVGGVGWNRSTIRT